MAEATKRIVVATALWVDAYLSNCHGSDLVKANINYRCSCLADLPEDWLIEDHMTHFVTHFALWFARN